MGTVRRRWYLTVAAICGFLGLMARPAGAMTMRPATTATTLACIRHYESGGRYSTDTGNGYYGAYQFGLRTWASIGGHGNPAAASPAVQDAMAGRLLAARGLEPWPTPARRCR